MSSNFKNNKWEESNEVKKMKLKTVLFYRFLNFIVVQVFHKNIEKFK